MWSRLSAAPQKSSSATTSSAISCSHSTDATKADTSRLSALARHTACGHVPCAAATLLPADTRGSIAAANTAPSLGVEPMVSLSGRGGGAWGEAGALSASRVAIWASGLHETRRRALLTSSRTAASQSPPQAASAAKERRTAVEDAAVKASHARQLRCSRKYSACSSGRAGRTCLAPARLWVDIGHQGSVQPHGAPDPHAPGPGTPART